MTTRRQRNTGGGRPSKGDRHQFITRVPRAAADRIQAEADRLDLSYSEYIAYVLANAHGIETPLPEHASYDQRELPLASSA